MRGIMRVNKAAGDLFLSGFPGDVILREGQHVNIIDTQETGPAARPQTCYAVRIEPTRGRPYVWVDESEIIITER